MEKLLLQALSRIRVLSGAKEGGDTLETLQKRSGGKERFKNRLKSPVGTGKSTKFRIDINDQKIVKELTFLQTILEHLSANCGPNQKYPEINSLLDAVAEDFKEESDIVENYARNKKLFRYLSCKWKRDKEDFQEKLLKCDEKIFDLENEIKEVDVENTIKSELVIKWEQARLEHTEGRFAEQKADLQRRIAKAKCDYDKELRIYNEVETFTRNEIERLQRLAVEWQQRYDAECSGLDEKIKADKLAIERTQDRIQALRETFVRKNIEIQAYLTQKAQFEEQRRMEKLKWDSAVRIQAWWRGTMYRNCLGPYRKKKKASKKGKKK